VATPGRDFSQRFADGAPDIGREYFHPEISWDTSASGLPSAGVYQGRQEVSKFFREWLGPWTDYEIEYREYIDAGNSVLCVFRQAGTGKSSGIRSERDFFALWYLEGLEGRPLPSVRVARASPRSRRAVGVAALDEEQGR
jgi:ketosteroid isomerase-like protein